MKRLFGILIAVICLCGSFAGLLFINSAEILDTNKLHMDLEDNNYAALITHEMSKGQNVELSLARNIRQLSDNVYECEFLVNKSENKNYDIKNIELSFSFSGDTDIISCFYSGGEGVYRECGISYEDGKIINCRSDDDYLRCIAVIKCDPELPLYMPELQNFEYDIQGVFPYTINKFPDITP